MHEVVYVGDGVGLGDFTLSIVKRFIWILQLSPKICIKFKRIGTTMSVILLQELEREKGVSRTKNLGFFSSTNRIWAKILRAPYAIVKNFVLVMKSLVAPVRVICPPPPIGSPANNCMDSNLQVALLCYPNACTCSLFSSFLTHKHVHNMCIYTHTTVGPAFMLFFPSFVDNRSCFWGKEGDRQWRECYTWNMGKN